CVGRDPSHQSGRAADALRMGPLGYPAQPSDQPRVSRRLHVRGEPWPYHDHTRAGCGHMITLDGKVWVVTGAANGIGQAIAALFREARAHVVGADIEAVPGCVQADVASEADARCVVEQAAEITGRIDVLCNNAAYLGPGHAAAEADAEE